MKETITIPEGVKEIEISKCSDKVIIEFVPEALKHKFKVGDKVKVKKGFPYEERILTITAVATTSDHQAYPYLVREVDYVAFPEHAFELYTDKPNVGDMVIAWDKPEDARIGILTEYDEVAGFVPFKLNNGVWYLFAIKWDGTREQYENVLSGKITLDP